MRAVLLSLVLLPSPSVEGLIDVVGGSGLELVDVFEAGVVVGVVEVEGAVVDELEPGARQ